MNRNEIIKKSKRIVVKIGTRIITHKDGTLDPVQVERLAGQIIKLKDSGKQVVIVTSGAIGAGIGRLGLKKRPNDISGLQGCAAVGQSELMHTYSVAFKKKGFIVGQILLTAEDLRSRTRYLNARNTLFSLLDQGIVPIVNENDTVIVDEIKFGDNDKLSALVTNLIQAELLLILTDVDGLYQPKKDGTVEHIYSVNKITKDVEKWCCGKTNELATGGMKSKLQAVKIVTRAGEGAIIANGKTDHIIEHILEGKKIGTFFEPFKGKLAGKKRWLAFFTHPHGDIIIDNGAQEALTSKGKSLLATGIVDVKGVFKAGEVVSIKDPGKNEFARGLVNYSSDEIEKIKKCKTCDIQSVLGYKSYDEVIHRNNIVIL